MFAAHPSVFEPSSRGGFLTQRGSNSIEDDAGRWQNAQRGEGPRLEHGHAVHEDLELAIRPPDDVDFGLQFASQARRHTDGMQSCDSVRAGSNLDLRHCRSRTGRTPIRRSKATWQRASAVPTARNPPTRSEP